MEFSMNTKQKEKADELGAVAVVYYKNNKYLACYEDKVTTVNIGGHQTANFSYSSIRQVILTKKSGFLTIGHIYINVGQETVPMILMPYDPNCILIEKKEYNELAEQITTFIQNKINEQSNTSPEVVVKISEADELEKFSKLKEQGIITKEEFEVKKKEILGL